jgi:DNA polymerase-3 subunit delta'
MTSVGTPAPVPPSGPEVIGQDRVVAALASALRAGRLAHALLFIGPPGVGRETTARALARGLLCERRDTPAAAVPFGCGACRACRRVVAGTHPDVLVVMSEAEAVSRGLAEPDPGKARPSAEIRIDAIRELCRQLPRRPYEGRARVVIVVDAHRMNDKAQNALLKGLEEPGDAENVLVLLVPGTRAVLPTIASRCQRIAFSPLSPDALRAILRAHGVADADARAARPGVASVQAALAEVADVDDAVGRLLAGLALRRRDDRLRDRLELAEAIGRDRLEVEALLRAAEQRLALRLRARLIGGRADVGGAGGADGLDGLEEVEALEGLAAARADLQGNGAVQLVIEKLLLGTPPSILERR